MKKLDLEVKTNARTYNQIKRDDYKAMYLSDDGNYEVFRIPIALPGEVFGTMYPLRERYPNTEEFGSIAWCTRDKDTAEILYNNIQPKKAKE